MEKLSVDEAKTHLYHYLTEYTGWKFLKSQQCLKKVIKDIVFEIRFFASKYNLSFESVEVNCELVFWCKRLDKTCNVHSVIGGYSFQPQDKYWYDISTMAQLSKVEEELAARIECYALVLIRDFEQDYEKAIHSLKNKDFLKPNNISHLNKNYENLLQIISSV